MINAKRGSKWGERPERNDFSRSAKERSDCGCL